VPGRTVPAAIDAFLNPLREAVSCLGPAHFGLTPGARGDVGETHAWTLNEGTPIELGNGLSFRASMQFETLDQGKSQMRNRFRVTTREYIYAVSLNGKEVIAAHWHPASSSPYTFPHWHIGSTALAADGVYLERAHIPSPRVSFEYMIRFMIEQMGVTPRREDWSQRLKRTESAFEDHKSW
jgi:hypothetical protein